MRRLFGIGCCLFLLAAAPVARAESEGASKEASKHFQRGVDLDGEGDFRGALVEFKKAYALLPRASVLYNIGQSEYQLQDYASSLRTLERFLAETGPNAGHRKEVEDTVEILRGRIGHIALWTDRNDCEVTIDEQVSGTTPLAQPMVVSIGRRRVAVLCPGRQRATREVDVAAGETVRVELNSPVAQVAAPQVAASAAPAEVAPTGISRRTVITAWTITGVLGAATIGLYTAAIIESHQLVALRQSYPVTAQQLNDKAKLTSRLALGGDIVAITTAVAAGLASYLSLSSHEAREERGVRVGLAWGRVTVQGSF